LNYPFIVLEQKSDLTAALKTIVFSD